MAGQKGMKWSPYKLKKRRLLRDLQKVYGRLKDQAVFPVDDRFTRHKPLALAMGYGAVTINQHIEKSVCRA